MMKSTLALLLALSALWGCSKEEFASTPKTVPFVADQVNFFQNLSCSNHTLIKPPVDILYIVDNSLSAGKLTDQVRTQITKTVQSISQEFDYRIMIAPLLPDGESDTNRPVITNNASSFTHSRIVNLELQSNYFFQRPTGSGFEPGFSRSAALIRQNRNVFRSDAHTIIVLVSNGDDTETQKCFTTTAGSNCSTDQAKMDAAIQNFRNLKAELNVQQLRFFSLVAHTDACQPGYLNATRYKFMSQRMYTDPNNHRSPATSLPADQNNRSTPDSYDLCSNEYAIYQGVNQSIRQLVLPHEYSKWQISESTSPDAIDRTDLKVDRLDENGVATPLVLNQDYTCCSTGTNVNTRVLPSAGEPKTGTFIDLTTPLKYPACLLVKTRTPTEYYSYVVAPTKPRPETTVVRVRGSNIPQSETNGWSYDGYRENQNIKVRPDGTPGTPALNRTGYFIRLNGTARYASGETVELFYTPAPL
ncbi:MAG: hypothetical protein ACLGG7_02650 [Bacteriovoracia bacterium]